MKDAPALHLAEFAMFQAVRGLVRALPHRGARALGALIGNAAFAAVARRRRTALANLELALPELDQRTRSRVARGAFRQMMSQAAELLSWDRLTPEALCRHWTLEGWEHVTGEGRDSPAAFLMTAHFGHWEVIGPAASLYAPPVAALVRPLDNPRLDTALERIRSRFGLTLIHKHGAARPLLRTLEEGGRVVVLLDQRVRRRDGVEVPFFGRPALTSSLIARLALKHAIPVVPVFAYPLPGGRYRIVARPPIPPGASGADPVRELTARYTAAVESEIRRHPELWLWMHDRWKLP